MGYTHYWTFKKGFDLDAYQKALKDCQLIVKMNKLILADAFGKGEPEVEGYVRFNGKGKDSHETFCLSEVVPEDYGRNEAMRDNEAGNFCKTARKPYDVAVTACLAVLKDYLGDGVEVDSDGYASNWIEGVEMANDLLKRTIANPILEERCKR